MQSSVRKGETEMASEIVELFTELELDKSAVWEPETLVVLRDRYESMVKQAEEAGEKEDSVLKQTVKLLQKDKKLMESFKTTLTSFLEVAHALIDEDPRIAILFVDLGQEFKQAMMYERDYYMSKSVVPINKKAKEATDDVKAKRELSKKLKRAIDLVFEMQDRPRNIKGFPVRETEWQGKKTGNIVPVLSKPRWGSDENDSPVGIAARNRKLRFRVDGTDLPPGTTPNDLAYRYVNDRKTGAKVTWSTITSAIKESGQQVMGDQPWKVKVAGKVIEGWKVESDSDS